MSLPQVAKADALAKIPEFLSGRAAAIVADLRSYLRRGLPFWTASLSAPCSPIQRTCADTCTPSPFIANRALECEWIDLAVDVATSLSPLSFANVILQ
jgi:hypothetical protein